MKHYFITWWTFFFECWCNGLLKCVPFTYQKILCGDRYTLAKSLRMGILTREEVRMYSRRKEKEIQKYEWDVSSRHVTISLQSCGELASDQRRDFGKRFWHEGAQYSGTTYTSKFVLNECRYIYKRLYVYKHSSKINFNYNFVISVFFFIFYSCLSC